MRYKVVPEAREVAFLRSARDALPLVPGSVEDCCTRIRDQTELTSRDAAREVLTFLEALELAKESENGYHRVRDDPGTEALATAFRKRVFAAEEVLDALELADEPLTAAEVFEDVRDVVPRWERHHTTEWEQEWTERVENLLQWGVAFGLVVERENGYLPADGTE